MSDPEARTRAFARVIGPFVCLAAGILAIRAAHMAALLPAFFANPIWPTFLGALLLLGGICIIAFHRNWTGAAAIAISLLGWFTALRGVILMALPDLMAEGADFSLQFTPVVQIGFAAVSLAGLALAWVGWRPPRT